MIASNITKCVMEELMAKGCACCPEMQIGDLGVKLGKNYTGLESTGKRKYKTAWRMRPDIWIVDRKQEITIIEVKSSRADFTSDKKWHVYRDFCHKFYFAIDGDYISKDELPAGVGLIDISKGYKVVKRATKNKGFKLGVEMFADLMFRMVRSLSYRQEK